MTSKKYVMNLVDEWKEEKIHFDTQILCGLLRTSNTYEEFTRKLEIYEMRLKDEARRKNFN